MKQVTKRTLQYQRKHGVFGDKVMDKEDNLTRKVELQIKAARLRRKSTAFKKRGVI